MKRALLLLALLFNISYGCATCMLMVPTSEIDVKLQVEGKKLKNIHFVWNFSDSYTQSIYSQYDKNYNGVLDPKESQYVMSAMLAYLKPKNMLSSVSYTDDSMEEAVKLEPIYKNFDITVIDDFMIFSYDGAVQKELIESSQLSLSFEDDKGYFAFVMSELSVEGSELEFEKNLYLFTGSILFSKLSTTKTVQEDERVIEKKSITFKEKEIPEKSYLLESIEKIKGLFISIKDEKNPMTYLVLLFFAFVYGVIHAMGPGHGKTLVASYFLANERSYSKALFISLAIGVVHTFSAFILTLIIYFTLSTLLSQFMDDALFYTTKVSAFIIIAIALYLLYKKYTLYKKLSKFSFTTSPTHIASCGCSSCKVDKNSTDIALIISAGIIPCPGTTTLFIFAISTGLFYAGFISALVMSLGMSSVIYVSALLSTLVREKALHSSERLKKYLEYLSLLFILILGAVLLFM